MTNPILLAIPAFFTLIGLEWAISRYQGRQLYRLNDTLTNLHLGAGQVLMTLIVKAPLLALYALCYTQTQASRASWGLEWWGGGLWSWVIGVLVMDCAYYWFHRFSHEVNALWTGHSVHHQSEEYNLSVALRQSWLQFIWSELFYLPLALIGIPPVPFFLLNATNTVGQFWIHTRLIKRLGPLEWVLNTPSHHRVHHGVDDEYIDKNYAGLLIIWDRMFGTFEPEGRGPRYGVVKPLRSWNSAWANVEVWAQLWRRAERAARARGASFTRSFIQLALHEPAWQLHGEEPNARQELRTSPGYLRYDAQESHVLYTALMGLFTLNSGLWVIGASEGVNKLAVSAWVLFHLSAGACMGALLDGRPWALQAERVRLYLAPLLALIAPLATIGPLDAQVSLWGWTISSLIGVSLLERGAQKAKQRARERTIKSVTGGASEATLLIIDPGTRHPELGCVAQLCRDVKALGLSPVLCLPALPHLVEPSREALEPYLDGRVMSLSALGALDPRRLGGVIILGSGASPTEQHDWQDELSAWLKPLLSEPHPEATPLLGLCYGHQLLAHLAGAPVAKLWAGEKASGLRLVTLKDQRLSLDGTYSLIVSHRDGVLSLPKGWRSLGGEHPTLERIGRPAEQVELDPVPAIEAMSHLEAPWWGFQPHIEAEQSFVDQNQVESVLPSPYDGEHITSAFVRLCAHSAAARRFNPLEERAHEE